MLVLDSCAVGALSRPGPALLAELAVLRRDGLWPPVIPTAVVVECLTGHAGRDAGTNRLVATCRIRPELPIRLARRAAQLRFQAGRGSAVDAIVAASAEPDGVVLTGDHSDLSALAAHADGVRVERI